jgi:hypothetical protein
MMGKFVDEMVKYEDSVIYYWVVEMFHQFYLEAKYGCFGLAEIRKNCIYIADSPFLKLVLVNKNNEYAWDNPLRVVLTGTVKDEVAYLAQLNSFGNHFKHIQSFGDL